MKDYLNYNGLAVMAHRGGSLEAPENTIESFKYAIEIGSDIIETDIQLSSDGVPYIFHDDDLKRIPGIEKDFNDLLASEIDELNIFGDFKIPTLEETLKQFPDTKFQIDFKTDEVVDPAIEIINKFPHIKKNLCVASFSSQRLQKIKSKLSDVTYSMGPHEVLKLLLKSFGIYRGEVGGDCLQIPIYRYGIKIVTKRFVDFCKRENIKISVWTINSTEEMDYLIDLDVDGIITDKPKALINLLASRNT
ncbi:MAG: glycerophosphodiester phosphodiesterase [Gammaproteobacteria bacterium]|nr:glycerophosphodiester phosphodiesterase [Gammaproteobacteria bacterium]|tara:strand:+ start:1165 stop:1908 length:744 start_codon:yes stop_codon:yes gene_type:complete